MFHPAASRGSSRYARQGSFTWQNILKNGLFIAFMVIVNKAGAPGNALFYLILCSMAMRSSEGALKALSLSVMVTTINPAFVSLSTVFAAGRMGILFLVAGRFMYDLSRSRTDFMRRGYVISFIGFCAVVAMLSVVNGYFVMVSLLKVLAFSVGAFAILVGAEVTRVGRSDITCWCYSFIAFCIILGGITLVTGVGYGTEQILSGGEGLFFKGPFFHSQTLGAIGALMLVYLVTLWIFSPYPYKWGTVALILGMLYMVYLTGSRTGLITAILACAAIVGLGFMTTGTGHRQVRFAVSRMQLIALAGIGGILMVFAEVFSGGGISSKATGFLIKYAQHGYGGLSWDLLFATRMPLIEKSLEIFRGSPMTGIGFGTSLAPYFIANATWYTAPTEKGFLPTALLEETGLIGSSLFWVFIALFLIYLLRTRNVSGFGMFVAFLILNLGEMTFFSFGGAGGMCWMLVGAGLALGPRCLTTQGGR